MFIFLYTQDRANLRDSISIRKRKFFFLLSFLCLIFWNRVTYLLEKLITWNDNPYKGNVATLRPKAVNRPTNRPIPARGSATVAVDKGPAVSLPNLIRPPLAGPYAFSRIPTPVDDNPKMYLLRDPPPTWIFTSVETGYYTASSSNLISFMEIIWSSIH